ncbi:MAG: DUF2384 domain-containing protein [Gammaproteobacteria bacterium]|nr:DUF2384 domain-containing protein [Gammaproteobacteria bacterium]
MEPNRQPDSPPGSPDARAAVLSGAVAAPAGRLRLKTTELTAIIGVSQPTASRLLHGKFLLAEGTKPWELAAHFVRLYRSLFSLVGGDDELAQAWLRSANAAFGGRPPLEVIRTVDGLVHACDYLDAHRARV